MKNRILIISGIQIFPPESGGQIRTAMIAESLAEMGNEVEIYSYTGRRKDYLSGKKSFLKNINKRLSEYVNLHPLFGFTQFLFYQLDLPPIWLTFLTHFFTPSSLRKHLKKADFVFLDFPYLHPLSKKLKKGFVLNTHNVEENLWKQRGGIYKLLSRLIRSIENKAVEKSTLALFCTELDKNHFSLKVSNHPKKAIIIPNGLNMDKIEEHIKINKNNNVRRQMGIPESTKLILFAGSSYFANVEAFYFIRQFCEKNSKLLRALDLKFLIVGSVSDKKSYTSGYIATSRVPDAYPYFLACDAAINPIFSGSGSNIKMHEYIALKLPVFTTKFGARGLTLEDMKSCFFFEKDSLGAVLQKVYRNEVITDFINIVENAYENNIKHMEMRSNIRTNLSQGLKEMNVHGS